MLVWRSLFFSAIVFSLFFFFINGDKIIIDTSLRDLSPSFSIDDTTQQSMDKLTEDISRNILFVIEATNETSLTRAEIDFRSHLSDLKLINVLSIDSIPLSEIIHSLSEYRFQLLSEEQQDFLKNNDNTIIAKQAQARIFRLSNAPLLSFDKDPLGLHGEYLSELLKKISANLNQTKSIPSNNIEESKYYTVIQTKLIRANLSIEAQKKLLKKINALSEKTEDKNQVKILRSGIFFFAVDTATKSKKDISLISSVSMLGVFLVLLFTFRSVFLLMLPFLSIAFGVAFAVAVSHSIYGKIHILTIVFGASLIGIVIDYSIHYCYHHSQATSSSENNTSKLHSALLLSLITSLLGYLALYFSQLDALKKVAIFSCCGLSMAWLSVICLGPYAKSKASSDNKIIHLILNTLKYPISNLKPAIRITLILILFFALLFSLFNVKTSDNPKLFFTADKEILNSEIFVSRIASDYEPGRFVIISGESSDSLFDNTTAFYNKVKDTPPLLSNNFKSITQWLPSPQQQNENYIDLSNVYGETGAINSFFELLGVDKSKATEIKNEYKKSANLSLQPDKLNQLFKDLIPPLWSGEQNIYRNFILITKDTDFVALEVLTKSMPNTMYFNSIKKAKNALAEQRISASKLLIVAYVFIIILMLLRYRKLEAIKVVLNPICASSSLVILFTLLGIPFNLFHVMGLFLVLGLGMDYGIFAYELQEGSVTQQAIFISAITSLLSFGLLGLSSIPVAQSFGTILFLGNSFNLIAALIFAESLGRNTNRVISYE